MQISIAIQIPMTQKKRTVKSEANRATMLSLAMAAVTVLAVALEMTT